MRRRAATRSRRLLVRCAWGALVLILLPFLGLFAWNVVHSYTSSPSGSSSSDPALFFDEQDEVASMEDLDAPPPLLAPDVEADPTQPSVPPTHLDEASDKWVTMINHYNPEAILYHRTDSFGNLYLLLGGWWLELPDQHQLEALDSLGRYWRSYLFDLYGDWDPDNEGDFAPGILLLDTEGEVFARNTDGVVEIVREPVYPPLDP